MAADQTIHAGEVVGGRLIGTTVADGIVRLVSMIRQMVDFFGRWCSLLFVPMVVITMFDVVLRKTGSFQIDLIEAAGPFGRMFESTLLQEMQWHLHTALFAMVLGYGYIWNTHVRVDLVRERLSFRRKAWLELLGTTMFMIPYTLIVIYFASSFAYDSFMISEISASQVGLPHRWIIKTILAIGLVVAVLAGLAVWLQTVLVLFGPSNLRYELMAFDWPEQEGSRFEGKERMDVDLTVSVDEDLQMQTRQVLGDEAVGRTGDKTG